MRPATLLLLLTAGATPAPEPAKFVQAVEFPYYLYPRTLWERELVWLKTIGVETVEFPIPWNWHQTQSGEIDFTGRTSPRRDLDGFIHLLRKLELRAWVRPVGNPDAHARQVWFKELGQRLAPQTQKHGGPIAFVEGRELAIDAVSPPAAVTVISAGASGALARSREAISSGRGALLWKDVEETVYPAGWEPAGAPLLRAGAVDLSGAERPATEPLRREAALLRNWSAFLPRLHTAGAPKPANGKLPAGMTASELISPAVSAVSLINRGESAFHDDLRVLDPVSRHAFVIPGVSLPAGESLWLPLNVSLGPNGLCRDCSNFSNAERIVYATAELLAVEFENGILAMEFAAPEAGEVILQLAREPVGPLLAAGKPTKFDWDEKTLRARLPVPASTAAGNRVRIGLAIEAPETSAFFSDARRLIIGRKNVISTVYSSAEVAARSRLRVPEGFTATATPKSPNEIEYTISVPPDALHGDWVSLALEADGVPLGRARVQLFRPLSLRLTEAIERHFGTEARLQADPPTATVDRRGGTNLELVLRNNSPDIRTYRIEASGDGLEFSPAKSEIAVGAQAERPVSLRVFAQEGASGVRPWRLKVSGGAELDQPFRAVLLPRGGTAAWSADLDGDGSPEWILESQKVRAVFSPVDGGRLLELTWKDTGTNFLPPAGALAQSGSVDIRAEGDTLQFTGSAGQRTASLRDATLTLEQSSPLPAETIPPRTVGNVTLSIDRVSPSRALFTIEQMKEP